MSDEKIDIVAARAQQEMLAQRFMRDVIEVASSEQIGTWMPPLELRGMHFIRCGVRDPAGGMPPVCRRTYQLHKSMGANDAPKTMRPPVGFESDGDRGVYVWYFPEIWANLQAFKARANRPKDPAKEFAELAGPGVEIETSTGYATPKRRK